MLHLGVQGCGVIAAGPGEHGVDARLMETGVACKGRVVDVDVDGWLDGVQDGAGPSGCVALGYAAGDSLGDREVAAAAELLVTLHDLQGNLRHLLLGHAGIDADVLEGAIEAVQVGVELEDFAVERTLHVEDSIAAEGPVAHGKEAFAVGFELAVQIVYEVGHLGLPFAALRERVLELCRRARLLCAEEPCQPSAMPLRILGLFALFAYIEPLRAETREKFS